MTTLNPIVSVIVPVYNTERYLPECVESIRQQTLRDIEVILVDDGASDNSGILCDEFARQDPRLRVIHQKNGGLSAARNAGLASASGRFVLFVDSDDWIRSDACEVLVAAADRYGADIVHGDFLDRSGEPIVKPLDYYGQVFPAIDYILRGVRTWSYDVVPVLNLVERRVLAERGLRFMEGVYFEDNEYTYRLYSSSGLTFVRIRCPFYYYRPNPAGITHTHSSNKALDCLRVASAMREYFRPRAGTSDANELATPILVVLGHFMFVAAHLSTADRMSVLAAVPQWVRPFLWRYSAGRMRFDGQNKLFAASPRFCISILRAKLAIQKSLRW